MIVYIETNGIIDLALKQEKAKYTRQLIRLAKANVIQLGVPAVSIAEAYYPLRERIDKFGTYLEQTQQLIRDLGRSTAKAYVELVRAANPLEAQLTVLLDKERISLDDCVSAVTRIANIIPLTDQVLAQALRLKKALNLTEFDAMVCASIVLHAGNLQLPRMAFLSFDEELVRKSSARLRKAGIVSFSNPQACIDYVKRFAI